MATNDTQSPTSIEELIAAKSTPNWTKDFPVIGQGTLIFSIQRSTRFFIVVRPNISKGKPGADQWIALSVFENSVEFSMFIDGKHTSLVTATGTVKNEKVGFEKERKISYWLSYDRDNLVLKYGKGYRMDETTLLEYDFLAKAKDPEKERKRLKYLFSHEIRRKIEQYDEMPKDNMIEKYTKSLIDIEDKVAFDRNPLVCNWSPLVLDSSKLNMFLLDGNDYTFSASLPSYCLELYSNVTAPNVDLDWAPTASGKDKYQLSDAIRHSLKNGILRKKLESKAAQFGSLKETYLRVTLGVNRGSSPGIPYVLEIWPKDHGSPIHNHGNSYAVIRVVHGGLTIKIFNKLAENDKTPELMKFDVRKGDITWISPNWFQTHQLWNYTDDYCATIQCYQYGTNDTTDWPFFDYVSDTSEICEFRPDTDYTFHKMRELLMKEFTEYMDKTKQ
uniref:Cysteine dioxygenase n=1 Tax=Amphimedon queenslandica TaxID=400682 RepID=A0A1X7VQ32_AMPQE